MKDKQFLHVLLMFGSSSVLFRLPSANDLQLAINLERPFPSDTYLPLFDRDKIITKGVRDLFHCATLCLQRPRCVAVNLHEPVGNDSRLCTQLDILITLEKWIKPKPLATYYHIRPRPYEYVGCYRNTLTTYDLLTEAFGKVTMYDDESFVQMATACGVVAWRRGYTVYGMKDGIQCYGINSTLDYTVEGDASFNDFANGCMFGSSMNVISVAVFQLV